MDLIQALRDKINSIEGGEHTVGLNAVLVHVEAAFKHLKRGQEEGDSTAYTDAIYRTNQVFEGSIKESYRILAGLNPENQRTFDIENYLTENNIFRPECLTNLLCIGKIGEILPLTIIGWILTRVKVF